jgi:drug/metabolite transporter (DMT)-like permease
MKKPHLLPYLALTFSVVLWGGSFAAMRQSIGEIGALGLMSLRSAVAAIVLVPFVPGFLKMLSSSWKKGDTGLLLLTVLLQPCLYFLFEANALKFTTASQAGLVSATVPVLTAFGAWIVLKEPISGRTLAGIAMAVAGIVVITFGGSAGSGASRPLLGNVLEFAAMICAAGNLVAVRGLSKRYNTWLLTAMQIYAGALFFLPGLIPVIRSSIRFSALPWLPIFYLGVASSIVAFGLYNWGMGRVPAARASSFINLVPVVAAFGAWLFLGETLSPIQMIGGAVVILGVLLSQQRPKHPAAAIADITDAGQIR